MPAKKRNVSRRTSKKKEVTTTRTFLDTNQDVETPEDFLKRMTMNSDYVPFQTQLEQIKKKHKEDREAQREKNITTNRGKTISRKEEFIPPAFTNEPGKLDQKLGPIAPKPKPKAPDGFELSRKGQKETVTELTRKTHDTIIVLERAIKEKFSLSAERVIELMKDIKKMFETEKLQINRLENQFCKVGPDANVCNQYTSLLSTLDEQMKKWEETYKDVEDILNNAQASNKDVIEKYDALLTTLPSNTDAWTQIKQARDKPFTEAVQKLETFKTNVMQPNYSKLLELLKALGVSTDEKAASGIIKTGPEEQKQLLKDLNSHIKGGFFSRSTVTGLNLTANKEFSNCITIETMKTTRKNVIYWPNFQTEYNQEEYQLLLNYQFLKIIVDPNQLEDEKFLMMLRYLGAKRCIIFVSTPGFVTAKDSFKMARIAFNSRILYCDKSVLNENMSSCNDAERVMSDKLEIIDENTPVKSYDAIAFARNTGLRITISNQPIQQCISDFIWKQSGKIEIANEYWEVVENSGDTLAIRNFVKDSMDIATNKTSIPIPGGFFSYAKDHPFRVTENFLKQEFELTFINFTANKPTENELTLLNDYLKTNSNVLLIWSANTTNFTFKGFGDIEKVQQIPVNERMNPNVKANTWYMFKNKAANFAWKLKDTENLGVRFEDDTEDVIVRFGPA